MKKLAVAVCAAVAAAGVASAGKVYYFDPVNGKDTNDGLSETTAFEHLSKKSGAQASDGDELRLMKGVYKESLSINRCNITVRGWKASRDEVIIDGEGVRRGINTGSYNETSYTNALIAGLTVRNGHTTTYASNYINLGAGITLESRDCVISNCVIRSCVHEQNGGGGIALMYGGKVIDCEIVDCGATQGAGIYIACDHPNPDFEVRGCTIANCKATRYAYVDDKGKAASRGGNGGGIYTRHGTRILGCTVNGNSATSKGGGIYFDGVTTSGKYPTDNVIADTVVSSNVTAEGGGVYFSSGCTNVIRRLSAVGNVSTNGYGGGVLAASQSRLDIEEGCAFVDNATETGYGGGIYIANEMGCAISNALFRGNRSVKGGGGAYIQTARSAFLNCVFDANSCSGVTSRCCGGAVRSGGGHGHVATFRNCLFTRNSACAGSGGAIGNEMTRSITNYLENCTFVSNFVYGTSTDSNDGYGGAVGGVSVSFCATNTVFFRNTSLSRTTYVQIQNKKLVAYANCFEDLLDGTGANFLRNGVKGCIVQAGDPGFTDAANGDYTLTKDSILVDKGINLDWMDAATDLRRKKRCGRIYNDIVDLGCYEYWPVPGLLLMVR